MEANLIVYAAVFQQKRPTWNVPSHTHHTHAHTPSVLFIVRCCHNRNVILQENQPVYSAVITETSESCANIRNELTIRITHNAIVYNAVLYGLRLNGHILTPWVMICCNFWSTIRALVTGFARNQGCSYIWAATEASPLGCFHGCCGLPQWKQYG